MEKKEEGRQLLIKSLQQLNKGFNQLSQATTKLQNSSVKVQTTFEKLRKDQANISLVDGEKELDDYFGCGLK